MATRDEKRRAKAQLIEWIKRGERGRSGRNPAHRFNDALLERTLFLLPIRDKVGEGCLTDDQFMPAYNKAKRQLGITD